MALTTIVSTFPPPLSFQLPLVNHCKGLLLQVALQFPQDFSNWRPLSALPYFSFKHTFWVLSLINA